MPCFILGITNIFFYFLILFPIKYNLNCPEFHFSITCCALHVVTMRNIVGFFVVVVPLKGVGINEEC